MATAQGLPAVVAMVVGVVAPPLGVHLHGTGPALRRGLREVCDLSEGTGPLEGEIVKRAVPGDDPAGALEDGSDLVVELGKRGGLCHIGHGQSVHGGGSLTDRAKASCWTDEALQEHLAL